MKRRPNLLVLASHGGSGFENLVLASRGHDPVLNATIVAMGCNNSRGKAKVWERADRLGIRSLHLPKVVRTGEYFRHIIHELDVDFIALSGWMCEVPIQEHPGRGPGLDPRKTFNIHPGPLPRYGGNGMYGEHVHNAVWRDLQDGNTTRSAVSMHFVNYNPPSTERRYDTGPVFFEHTVMLQEDDTPEDIAARVNAEEHRWQPSVTDLVVKGEISWDGIDPKSLITPNVPWFQQANL